VLTGAAHDTVQPRRRRAARDAALVESADLTLLCADQPLRLSHVLGARARAPAAQSATPMEWPSAAIAQARRFLAEHMLAGGAHGPTPRMGSVTLAPGLGLTNRLVIDQGGASADRLGRC
jgi:cyanophycinase